MMSEVPSDSSCEPDEKDERSGTLPWRHLYDEMVNASVSKPPGTFDQELFFAFCDAWHDGDEEAGRRAYKEFFKLQ